ncbi:MAG: hypothetical protein OXG68_01005 [Chloroflexi bacterium]|nr:hypothetical protein [Chloroflexota bacterium]MCY3914589.1 hypothetical protein [Chloroflexota bacterium]
MSDKSALRREAILDGMTGIVGIPSVLRSGGRDYPSRRYWQSDVERSWTFIGKYLRVAMQENEAESESAPIIREDKSNS